MALLLFAQFATAGIALSFAVLHFAMSFRHESRRLHLSFALFSLGSLGDAALSPLAYTAGTLDAFIAATRWTQASRMVFAFSLIWFVSFYVNRGVPALLKLASVLLGFTFLLNTFAPGGVLFAQPPLLETVTLPWGETIVAARGPRSPMLLVANLATLSAFAYLVTAYLDLRKSGEARKGRRLGVALLPLLAGSYPHAVLVNWGVVNPPFLHTFSYLPLLIMMSYDLMDDAVRAAQLARQVQASEQRWRSLLENVHLIVIGLDREGRFNYLNPYFLKASGYTSEELLGRSFPRIAPESDAPRLAADYRRIIETRQPDETQSVSRILRKDGEVRTIQWSTVPIVSDSGEVSGVLSVGIDTTDQEKAEAARDGAMRELQQIRERLEAENLYLKEEIFFAGENTGGIMGQSPAIRYVFHKIEEVARTDATVLIQGETGVGKELVARALHRGSARASGPYIRVNCSALPANLVESELFGHERGAFTGAEKLRRGRFELANGGTLLLDEIGELPLEAQAKLLRVLQEGEFERVGDSTTRKTDVRIIAATNRDLRKEVLAGRFREDLYYRLQVYPITVPPLRDRREDIPLLVEHFTQQFAKQHGKRITEISGSFLMSLADRDWPGNIRELENFIERAVISSSGATLRAPFNLGEERIRSGGENPGSEEGGALDTLEEVERKHLLAVMKATGGKIAGEGGAAQILGLNPSTLRSRMAKLNILKTSPARRARSAGRAG